MTFLYSKTNRRMQLIILEGKNNCNLECESGRTSCPYIAVRKNKSLCYWLSHFYIYDDTRLQISHANKLIFDCINSSNPKNYALLHLREEFLNSMFYENILKGDKFYFEIIE
jgi:hypothetical protein